MTTTAARRSAASRPRPPVDALHPHERLRLEAEVPIIVRGDGCYLEDSNGKRYLDALAGLFSVNLGYGFGEEIGQAALEQMRSCPSTRTGRTRTRARSSSPASSPRSRPATSTAPSSSPAARRRSSRPGSSRASTSSRAAASGSRRRRDAARRARGRAAAAQVQGDRPPGRLPRHDDGRALDQRDPGAADAVRAARARGAARDEHEPLPPSAGGDGGGVHAGAARRTSRTRSSRWGRRRSASSTWSRSRTRAAPSRRRQGYWRGVRELCDRYDILLSADEVITALRPRRPLVRLRALRHPPGHRLLREGALLLVRRDRRGDRDRQGDGAVPRVRRRCTRTGSPSAATR